MANVLGVAALKVGNPVVLLVLVKTDNPSRNAHATFLLLHSMLAQGTPKAKSAEPAATATYCFPLMA